MSVEVVSWQEEHIALFFHFCVFAVGPGHVVFFPWLYVSCESPACLRLGHYRSGMIRERLENVRMVRASLALGYFQCLEHASVSAFTDFLAKESFSYEE